MKHVWLRQALMRCTQRALFVCGLLRFLLLLTLPPHLLVTHRCSCSQLTKKLTSACNLLQVAVLGTCCCVGMSGPDCVLQRDEIVGKGVAAQTTAGNPERHTPRRKASPRARTNDARTGAHKQGPKQPATTRNTECALRRREQSNTLNIKQP